MYGKVRLLDSDLLDCTGYAPGSFPLAGAPGYMLENMKQALDVRH